MVVSTSGAGATEVGAGGVITEDTTGGLTTTELEGAGGFKVETVVTTGGGATVGAGAAVVVGLGAAVVVGFGTTESDGCSAA